MVWKLKLKWTLGLAVAVIVGCSPTQHKSSETLDLVANRNVRNYALIFAASNGLEGVAVDKAELMKLFKESNPEFNFEVVSPDEPSAKTMLDTTTQYAAQAGTDGTLIWYFSGHGAGDGTLMSTDGMVSSKEIAEAVKKGRATPLKRMLMFMDSCFSGQNVNGTASIFDVKTFNLAPAPQPATTLSYAQTPAAIHNQNARALAENAAAAFQKTGFAAADGSGLVGQELLAMSASRADETSADLGSDGGAFTKHLRETWAKLKQARANDATINDLATQTSKSTENEGHTPQFKAVPESLLQEKLFVAGTGTTSIGTNLFAHFEPDAANPNNAFLYVAGGTNVARVIICRGPYATCAALPRDDIPFATLGMTKNGLSVNRSVSSLDLNTALGNNQPFTMLGVNAQNQIVSVRTVAARPK